MNPEFIRNIWRELSVHRLIVMPLILFAIFYIDHLLWPSLAKMMSLAFTINLVLLVIWGSGLAADSVLEEMREGTWNSQRMTPLGAWSMTWAKLLGSTVFVWYGSLFCLLMMIVLSRQFIPTENSFQSQIVIDITRIILTGLFAQSLAFFIAMLFQRISVKRSRVLVVLIQLFVIAVTYTLYFFGKDALPQVQSVHSWYDLHLDPENFISLSQVFFISAFVFGSYRLMRLELQLQNRPWDLVLAGVFVSLYFLGFVYVDPDMIPVGLIKAVYFAIFLMCFLGLTFGGAFFANKNVVRTRRTLEKLKTYHYVQGWTFFPPWVLTGLLSLILAFCLIWILRSADFPKALTGLQFIGLTLGLILFICRDIGLLFYISWTPSVKRPEMTTVVYLIVLYLLLPSLLGVTGIATEYWLPALVPWSWVGVGAEITWSRILFVNFLVLLQAILVWWGVNTRYELYQRRMK